jgi:hypothetical protein
MKNRNNYQGKWGTSCGVLCTMNVFAKGGMKMRWVNSKLISIERGGVLSAERNTGVAM